MDLNGLDALLAKLERMHDEIEEDVDTVVKNNTLEMTKLTIKNEVRRFNKGYWTGHTARSTKTEKLGDMHYRTIAGSDYSAFLNFGTRYFAPTWFMRDAYFRQKQIFLSDLERLVK